jgi:protocatechuate 3,4-dioxygenase beta subunit
VGCTLTPEQEEGPYYRDLDIVRSDITEGRDGVPLRLAIRVVDAACAAVAGASVDVWHCDAHGAYSWESDVPRTVGGAHLEGGTFLRGTQSTDEGGNCAFSTIYPGWYHGRSVHIHFKVRNGLGMATGQLYFPERLTEAVHRLDPYSRRTRRDTLNETDVIYSEGGTDTTLIPLGTPNGFEAAVRLSIRRSRP